MINSVEDAINKIENYEGEVADFELRLSNNLTYDGGTFPKSASMAIITDFMFKKGWTFGGSKEIAGGKIYKYKTMEEEKVNINDLKPNEIVHKELDEKLVSRIKHFHKKLEEVSDTELAVTLENFRRDLNPEKEVIIWETITNSYEEAIQGIGAKSIDLKNEVYNLVLLRSLMSSEDVLEQVKLKTIDKATAGKVLNYYKDDYESVKISTKK